MKDSNTAGGGDELAMAEVVGGVVALLHLFPSQTFVSGPWIAVALVKIRQLLVQITALGKTKLLPLRGLVDCSYGSSCGQTCAPGPVST